MPRRRDLMMGAGALAAAAATRAVAGADPDSALGALLSRHMDEYLAMSPEAATSALNDARGKAARWKLDDRSPAGKARATAAARRWRAELKRIDRAALSPAMAIDYDCAAFSYEMLAEVGALYGFQDHALRPGPYIVSQMSGAYYWLPQRFAHAAVATRDDADAYLSRLAAFAVTLDQERARIAEDAAAGVRPPDFILATTMGQIAELRDTGPAGSSLVKGPAARADAAGLHDVGPAARKIFETQIAPALDRQAAALAALKARASTEAGVWRLPRGDEWYALGLRSNTTVATPPEEMHQLGLDTFARMSAELDGLLKAQGLTQGPVGARLQALDVDPRFLKTNDDAGRAEILAYAHLRVAKVQALLPKAFRTLPDRDMLIERAPIAIQDGAPGAEYSGPPADGSRPGVISINLKTPSELPTWRIPTLLHHEGDPGHHLQGAVFRKTRGDRAPLYKQFAQYSAYVEGWAHYAERLAGEIGAYEDDPFGKIGAVQAALFRAARIVVDTGIHHKRWSRAEATGWMVENAGEPVSSAQREIDRYCVYPGQACAFMVGRLELVRVREAAKARQGAAFDVRDWHEAVLRAGPVPMEVLGRTFS
ncbi:DUF885 family protein [Phenylobacterium sp.]|uniref:DUF885 domain-containing protein n=1 Tax=Phenylobacterium sp. TaxID=1871053 RepID=UPI0025FEE843|nr:DUF885 family protein [Phenylobacterium sp.]